MPTEEIWESQAARVVLGRPWLQREGKKAMLGCVLEMQAVRAWWLWVVAMEKELGTGLHEVCSRLHGGEIEKEEERVQALIGGLGCMEEARPRGLGACGLVGVPWRERMCYRGARRCIAVEERVLGQGDVVVKEKEMGRWRGAVAGHGGGCWSVR